MTDLSTIIEHLDSMRDTWRRDALASVPPAYADRNMHDKYLKEDNEAAGQYSCADELDEVIRDLEALRGNAREAVIGAVTDQSDHWDVSLAPDNDTWLSVPKSRWPDVRPGQIITVVPPVAVAVRETEE